MSVESHIGQYKILRTLGAGGMGTVYLGEHILLARRAAIKTLLPALSSHREIVDRFFNEARAISAISDPGVVQIFDFGYHVDGTAYIVMEYLEGESLSARLERLGKLPMVEALRITRQIAASLSAAHARGIIHRDLKPANVFLIRDSEAQGGERTKILDFGIAKLVSSPTDLVTTQTGTMLGTPVYMSPEQCRGAGKIDSRSDIYSAGCALFHMLTGVPPFDCDSVGDFIAAHLKEAPPKPSELSADLPPAVDALMSRCLAKNPDERFQTMAELQAACEDVLAHLSDPGRAVIQPLAHETPLGEGFHSEYDVNREDRKTASLKTPRPSQPAWFVDSMGGASELPGDDREWVPPERGTSLVQRAALIFVLFAGLVGGLVLTSYVLEDHSDATVLSPSTPMTSEPLAPAAASAHEPAPPLPIAETDAIVEELVEEAIGEELTDTASAPAVAPVRPAAKKRADRPNPARTQTRPRPRRPAPAPAVEIESEEDLYDTR